MPNPGEALRISQEQHPNLTQSRMGDTNIKKIFISTVVTSVNQGANEVVQREIKAIQLKVYD